MEMFKAALRIAIAILALSATSFAYNQWNVNGTSCVADAGSIFHQQPALPRHGRHDEVRGGERPATSSCIARLPAWVFTPTLLGLTYFDDSRVAGNHVTAQLIKMDISTGLITPPG
jgi:hypothetical protein